MSFWCLQFPTKSKRKQVDLRCHSSKVEFVRLFFEGNVDLKKSFRFCLTFSKNGTQKKQQSHDTGSNVVRIIWIELRGGRNFLFMGKLFSSFIHFKDL